MGKNIKVEPTQFGHWVYVRKGDWSVSAFWVAGTASRAQRVGLRKARRYFAREQREHGDTFTVQLDASHG